MPSSSTAASLFLLFTDRLERLGLRHIVTGSVARILCGERGLTHAVDLVLEIAAADDASAVCAAFPEDAFCGLDQSWGAVLAERPARW